MLLSISISIKCIQHSRELSRDGVSTIQMYSSTSTITLNMHEYEYSNNKCTRVRVRLLYNILEYEYDYFRTVSQVQDYFHDYFNEYPVSLMF